VPRGGRGHQRIARHLVGVELEQRVDVGVEHRPWDGGRVAVNVFHNDLRDLLYRRNSLSGAIEVVQRTGTWGGLNAALHATD
jgi:hypothetical protein